MTSESGYDLDRVTGPIVITEYQSRWPAEFAELAVRLRRAAGDLALRIDHIGSTSVPGLAAKDVIDVQVTVADVTVNAIIVLEIGTIRRRCQGKAVSV